jgi:FkbM family methyltransferase
MSNFYGQFNTDSVIKEYFPNLKNGNCIEVGAVDGVFLSNTLHFEQIGWNVLCIEPIPPLFEGCKGNRKNCINYAVTKENKDNIEFTVVTLSDGQKSAISGLEVDNRLIESHHSYNPIKSTINVKGRRLDWCIENYFNYEKIDFISIDTEGSELDVLMSFDVNKYDTKLLIIENNFNDPEIESYLNNLGWSKDKRIAVNDFYIKK